MFDIKRSLEPLNIPPIPSHEILAVVFTAFPTGQTGELWLLLSYPQQKPITAPSFFAKLQDGLLFTNVTLLIPAQEHWSADPGIFWSEALVDLGWSHTHCVYIYMPWYDGVIWLKKRSEYIYIYMYIYMLGIVGLYHILKFPDISWYIV